jgi:putative transposase
MRQRCGEARFVWNLALEQLDQWRPGRAPSPNSAERFRQLAEARRETWLGEGSSIVQQQALRDFDRALANWWGGSHRRPTRRKRGRSDGFCVRDVNVRTLNAKWSEVAVPKCGHVRFRLSRPLLADGGMARVTLESGRWHVSFAAPQAPVRRKPTGTAVGVDLGVATTVACSDGVFLRAPRRGVRAERRLRRLQQRLSRQHKGSNRRARTKEAIAELHQRQRDRLRNWTETQTTKLVRKHDVIAVEALEVRNMVRRPAPKPDDEGGHEHNGASAKAGLNRAIHRQGWGQLRLRLEQKAEVSGVSVPKPAAHYSSQECRACGVVASESRESQARFRCVSCGHVAHADRNAAENILARGLALPVLAPTPGQGASRPKAGARGSRHQGAARTTGGLQ